MRGVWEAIKGSAEHGTWLWAGMLQEDIWGSQAGQEKTAICQFDAGLRGARADNHG